jgi:lysophospholipase
MSVVVDTAGPKLVSIPANPVPETARVGYFKTSDNIRLRYATWQRATPELRGTICLVQGRTEYIEKYFETIEDFRKRGFAVATFDWRGQGGSDRLIGNPHLGYVDKFEDYWTDLKSFYSQILLPDCPPPFYLVGHSMGGLASLFAATKDRMMFERVFLSAPMVALDRQPMSMKNMARLAETISFIGLGKMPIGRKTDQPPSEKTFPNNPLTGDKSRYLRAIETIRANPELEIGSPTVRWVASAMGAMSEAARPDFTRRIQLPILIMAAARDQIVSTAATEQLGLHLRTGRHQVVPAAQHELFMETNAIREQVFAAFDAFITQQTS